MFATTSANAGPIQRVRAWFSRLITELQRTERWVLLSSCDWYPDGSSYPTNHAALLNAQTRRD
jgi:hypothetical protein